MTKRYFHIQRLNGIRKEWFEGEIINTNENNLNNFYADLIESTGQFYNYNERELDLINYSNSVYKNLNRLETFENYEKENLLLYSKIEQYKMLTSDLHENLLQYLKWTREEIFENIRKSNFNNLPSRKTCIWLTEIENIPKWWKMFKNSTSKKILEIEIEPNSKLHYADGFLIKTETLKINQYEELAMSYWSGKIENNVENEILFEGTFKVIGEFKNIEEIKSYC